ncbi:MAG: hypothetical protein JWR22_3345 [Herminiimonas sp.]|nr:hypothetical protein [Herminiimonas sp.]
MRRFLSPLCRFLTGFLVMTILTSGLAMAAYICPQIPPAPKMEMAMGSPCAGMDKEMPVHCAEYQSSALLALEHLAAPPVLTPVVIAAVRPAPAPVQPTVPTSSWEDSPLNYGADPPYLRTRRLRI